MQRKLSTQFSCIDFRPDLVSPHPRGTRTNGLMLMTFVSEILYKYGGHDAQQVEIFLYDSNAVFIKGHSDVLFRAKGAQKQCAMPNPNASHKCLVSVSFWQYFGKRVSMFCFQLQTTVSQKLLQCILFFS